MISVIFGKKPGKYGGEEQKNEAILQFGSGKGESYCFYNNAKSHTWLRIAMALIFFLCGKSARVGYFYPLGLRKEVRKNLLKNEIIIVSLPQNVTYSFLRCAQKNNNRIIIDFADRISKTYSDRAKYSGGLQGIFWEIEARRFKEFEDKVYFLCDQACFASRLDCVNPKDRWLPPPTNLQNKHRPRPAQTFNKGNYLLFGGALNVYQNRIALSILNQNAEKIRAKIKIYGATDNINIKKYPGLEFLGRVDDLEALLLGSIGFIAPLPVSGGVQNKVLEALSYGVPVFTDSSVLDRIGILEFYPSVINYTEGGVVFTSGNTITIEQIAKAAEYVCSNYGLKNFITLLNKIIEGT